MRWLFLVPILHAIAAVLAAAIARKRSGYRPVAAFFMSTAIADLALAALIAAGAPTALPAAPLTGLARLLGHVRQALYRAWPFGFTAMFVAIFAGRRPWAVGAAYVVTITMLVLGYPTIGGELLRKTYSGIELAALAVAAGAFIPWIWRRESPRIQHVMAILLLSGEVALLLGPWHHDIFEGWDAGRIMYATAYIVFIVFQGGVLWNSSEQSSSEPS